MFENFTSFKNQFPSNEEVVASIKAQQYIFSFIYIKIYTGMSSFNHQSYTVFIYKCDSMTYLELRKIVKHK